MVMARNRGRRGDMELDDNDELQKPRPEDSIVVVASDGEPIEDGGYYEESRDPVIAGHETLTETETDRNDEAFQVLQRSFDALKNDSAALRAENEQLRERNKASQADVFATQKAVLQEAKANADGRLATAKAAYAAAMSNQDYEAAAEAQEAIADAKADQRQYAEALVEVADMEKNPPRQETRPAAATPSAMTHDQQVDAFIKTLSPKTAEFAQQHRGTIFPANGSLDRLNEAIALDGVARARNIKPDTPEYFAFLEDQMGLKDAKPTGQRQPPRQKTPARQPRAAAPVNNRAGNQNQPTRIELSRDELNMAARLNMTPARYALHKKTAQERANDPDYRGPKYSRDDPAIVGVRR